MRLLSFLPRFRKAARALAALEERESWPRARIEALQLERVNALWAGAAAHVPYYRRLAEAQRLPPRFAGLDEFRRLVPVLPRSAVHADVRAFLSARATAGSWHSSSGSTGAPTRFFWAHDAHREMLHAVYRFHASWGLDLFDPLVFFWGPDPRPGGPLRAAFAWLRRRLEDRLRQRLRLPAQYLASEDLRVHLARIGRFAPRGVYGLSKAVHLLAREAVEAGFACPSLRLVILTGEPPPPGGARAVEGAFGVPAVEEYGAVECGFIAGEAPDRTLRVREDRILLEALPRPDGRFDLVLTVLDNPSFPLIRYAIADVTDEPLRLPEHGFAVLHNVAGRDCDLLVSRSGRRLHPVNVDNLFEGDLGCGVRRYRVRQAADGAVLAEVEREERAGPPDAGAIRARLTQLVEGFPVRVEVVAALPAAPRGKHRVISSEMTAPLPG
jgi:phenylacetate-CoA ligase